MSNKKEKDYDPTLLRAVGNILAGADITNHPWTKAAIIEEAVSVVLAAKKELQKQTAELS